MSISLFERAQREFYGYLDTLIGQPGVVGKYVRVDVVRATGDGDGGGYECRFFVDPADDNRNRVVAYDTEDAALDATPGGVEAVFVGKVEEKAPVRVRPVGTILRMG